MKKKLNGIFFISIVAMVIAVGIYSVYQIVSISNSEKVQSTPTNTPQSNSTDENTSAAVNDLSAAENILAQMSLREKVSQMFVFALPLAENESGGVILLGKDITSERQLIDLTTQLQKANPNIPLFIAVDQEGGIVKRVSWDSVGSHKQIAALPENEQCAEWRKRGETLRKAGINWNFGIVADVTADKSSFIYPRVFSGSYDDAAKNTATAVKCEVGVLNTLKHWPGHGATALDTHSKLAKVNSANEETWLKSDGLPFVKGAEAGADTIMLGHLIISWLDDSRPVTLSPRAISYLRNEQKFTGLIVTDDLNMLTQSGYTLEQATKEAFLAGDDVFIISSGSAKTQTSVIDSLVKFIETSSSEEKAQHMRRIDDSISRILEKKSKIKQNQI